MQAREHKPEGKGFLSLGFRLQHQTNGTITNTSPTTIPIDMAT